VFRKERETLQKLILVPYRALRNLSLGIGGVLLIIAAGFGGFYAGARYSVNVVGATPDEVQRLRQTVRMYAEQSQSLREQAAVSGHDRDIVLAATEQLREENKNLLEGQATLQDQISMYKKLLSPRSAAQGLDIEKLDMRSRSNGKVAYRLLITQANSKATDIGGNIEARLVGNGRSVVLPVGDNRFSLQYFQNLAGEWEIPAGFTPERVDIVLTPAKGAPVQKSFRWSVSP
jgi:hypothetical protein